MAGEEDVELRDLVAQTLEAKGVLGKIRAQLRASVFLALEEQESQQRPHPLVSSKLEQFQKTKEGKLVTALVREFLEYFELEYTRSVFDPETNALESYPGRERIAKDLNLDSQATSSGPLLAHLVEGALSLPPSSSRQPHFTDPITSSSHAATSGPSQLATTACSDVSRAAVAATGSSGSSYSQATPTLHSLGSRPENDSEHFSHLFTQSQLNDKHLKQPAVSLNSNENSSVEGTLESKLASLPRTDLMVTPGLPGLGLGGLGVGLGGLQSQGAYAELGESFVNSADSSFDTDKLMNVSPESERLRGLLKPHASSGSGGSGRDVGEPNRDELNDFFDSSPVPSVLQDSKDQGLTRETGTAAGKSKSDELAEDKEAYEDDFHSEELSSHVSEQLEDPSQPLETEDRTFSQSSLSGAMDYIEPVHS